jgi:uncharacterized protein YjgD (DUF1641 family)
MGHQKTTKQQHATFSEIQTQITSGTTTRMQRITFSIIATIFLLFSTDTGQCVLPVEDYASLIQSEVNHIASYIRQGLQYVQEQTTAEKEIQQVLNQIEQLSRMGNPAQLMQLPGASNIQTLAVIVQNFKTQVAQLETLVNPNTAVSTANKVLQEYGQPLYNGFTTMNGSKLSPNTSLLQFSASNYNTISAVQANVQSLQTKKQTLSQQRDQAISSMQSASDQSTVQKESGIIAALNGAISDVNAQITQSVQSGQAQQQKNQAAQQISQATQAQVQQAASLQSLEADVLSMPSAGIHSTVAWGSN